MGKAEIIAGLDQLRADELADVRARIDELVGDAWNECGDLTDQDKSALDTALAEYQKNPNAGDSWPTVRSRIEAKLRPSA